MKNITKSNVSKVVVHIRKYKEADTFENIDDGWNCAIFSAKSVDNYNLMWCQGRATDFTCSANIMDMFDRK